jgi:hypothetical protein
MMRIRGPVIDSFKKGAVVARRLGLMTFGTTI